MDQQADQTELYAKLADETLRANALAAELEVMRNSPSWQAVELLRLKGRKTKVLVKVFRKITIFLIRLVPEFGLIKRVDPKNLARLQQQVLDSKLFDANWYESKNPDAKNNSAEHFLQTGTHIGLDPGPLFQSKWYRSTNPDIGQQNPLVHYLDTGASEGRLGWSMQRVIALQRPYANNPEHAIAAINRIKPDQPFPILHPGQQVQVFASSQGNSFFTHIRDMVCRGLCQAGVAAKVGDETNFADLADATPIILAPHEFFYLGAGKNLQNESALKTAICINTEQMQTRWFSMAYPYLARSCGVLDMNVQTAAILADMGIASRYLTPGYLADDPILRLQKTLPDEPSLASFCPQIINHVPARAAKLTTRPIDVLFVGANTPRRQEFFAKSAKSLADKVCALHLTDMSRPVTDGGGVGLSAIAYAGLSQRSKIQLNIHHGVVPYFEWHRMILHGFWHRTALVTETSFRALGYQPGVHYFEDELDKLPDLLEWLLRTKDGGEALEKVSTNAFDQLRSMAGMEKILTEVFQIDRRAQE